MIPTSIDGTDITGATIDGTDVTEITVDGQTVFTAVATPPQLTDLYAHYDPSDSNTLTTSGNDVTQIDDKIGTNHLNTSATNLPSIGSLNGNTSLLFDRGNQEAIHGDLDTDVNFPITICVAFKQTTVPTSGLHTLFFSETPSQQDTALLKTYNFTLTPSNNYSFYAVDDVNSGVATDTNAHTIIAQFDGSDSELFLDNSSIVTGDTGDNNVIAKFGLGGKDDATDARNFDGQISQVLIYDAKFNRSTITDIHNFLNTFI